MKNFIKSLKNYIHSELYNLKHYHKIKLITLIFIIIFFPLTIPLSIFAFMLGILLSFLSGKKEYDKSLYKLVTKKTYFTVLFNTGDLSEYCTWKILNNEQEYKKILINLYIPNKNHTSEIDSVLINEYGIFVIESKGYSGWIFGSERDSSWTQIIYKRKIHFYNPITQNRNHIISLANLLNIENMNIFKSYIVFSNRCELKKITVTKPNVKVIKRPQLQETLDNDYKVYGKILNKEQIDYFYNKLYNYMFSDTNIKEEHIKYVKTLNSKK